MFDLDPTLSSKYTIGELSIEFVEGKKGVYPTVKLPFEEEDIRWIREEIADMWEKIHDLEFWRGVLRQKDKKVQK